MSSEDFGIQAISVNGSGFAGVRGQSREMARTINSEGSDGTVFETLHTLSKSAQVASYDTVAAKTMLSAMGSSGTAPFPFVKLNGSTGLIMYCGRSASLAPGYDTGSYHLSRTALNGVITMERLAWGGIGQDALLSCKAFYTSTDGTTDPVSLSTTIAVGSLPTPANTEAYVLSALTLDGVSIGPVNSCEIDIGHKFEYQYLAGLPYPTNTRGAGPNGRAELRLMADINGIELPDLGTGSVSAVFTARASGGTLGSSTLTFTFNGPWTIQQNEQGSNAGPMSGRFEVRPKWNGTTNPLTWVFT